MSTKIVSRARNFTRHYSVLRDFVYNLFARKSVDSTKNFKMTACGDTLPSRGALIVFEGCDRSGKTTQCSKLEKSLQEKGHCVKLMKFPGDIYISRGWEGGGVVVIVVVSGQRILVNSYLLLVNSYHIQLLPNSFVECD